MKEPGVNPLIMSPQNPIIFLARPLSVFLVMLSLVLLAVFVISEGKEEENFSRHEKLR